MNTKTTKQDQKKKAQRTRQGNEPRKQKSEVATWLMSMSCPKCE